MRGLLAMLTGGEKTTPHLRAKSRLRRLRSETHLRVQSQKSKIFASSPDKGSLFYAFFRYLINAEVVEIMHTRSVKKAVEPTMAV